MFCQPPDEESQVLPNNLNKSNAKQKNKQKKRKKKSNQKKLKHIPLNIRKRCHKFDSAMSTWAESFTVAATWQLKHQLAYWKAKAKSLEYENNVLHDIIRKKNYVIPTTSHVCRTVSNSDEADDCEEHMEDDGSGAEFEASEEWIQFLTANAKYKEDARRERELLKAKYEEENIEEEVADATESTNITPEQMEELYGDKWQKISALETKVQLHYMNINDHCKPTYWPNIPFNFNYNS